MRKIKACAGIGDNLWLLQKLINAKEKFHFHLARDNPKRGKPLFDLLPQVAAKTTYSEQIGLDQGFGSNDVIDGSIHLHKPKWSDINDSEFYLSINKYLETGKRIEKFLPDLDITYKLPFKTSKYKPKVTKLLKRGKKYIGIYTSCYDVLRNWNFWEEYAGFDLMQKIRIHEPDVSFVIIGAHFDLD